MNRKSMKRYTLVLSGPHVRGLSRIAHYGMNAIRKMGQEPYYIGSGPSVDAARRALRDIDAILEKVAEDEKP